MVCHRNGRSYKMMAYNLWLPTALQFSFFWGGKALFRNNEDELVPGLTGETKAIVTEANTAASLGTPAMVGLLAHQSS